MKNFLKSLSDEKFSMTKKRQFTVSSFNAKEPTHNGQVSIMIGPMFVHQKKELNFYHVFASSLFGLKPTLQGIQCIGTDEEVALSDGFQLAMPSSKHVLCFIHLRRNIKHKLGELGMPERYVKEYMSEIFGVQTGTHFTCGLVDCTSEEEFDLMLRNLVNIWNKREKESRNTELLVFFEWFLHYQALNFKEKMLLPLRKSIGQGIHHTQMIMNALIQ